MVFCISTSTVYVAVQTTSCFSLVRPHQCSAVQAALVPLGFMYSMMYTCTHCNGAALKYGCSVYVCIPGDASAVASGVCVCSVCVPDSDSGPPATHLLESSTQHCMSHHSQQ